LSVEAGRVRQSLEQRWKTDFFSLREGLFSLRGAGAGSRPGGRVTFFVLPKKVTKEGALKTIRFVQARCGQH
jgi:hypothetical protein